MKSIFDKTTMKGNKLKNRIFRSATWMSMADENGHISRDGVDLYKQYSQGEVAAIITGITSIHKKGEKLNGIACFYDDTYIEENRRITDAVHEDGAVIFLQSAIVDFPGNVFGEKINNLTKDEITDIVTQFKDSAVRAEKAGFDGIQIHAAHFFYLSKFISPLVNKRNDEYGGSNRNRARILVDIIEAIKAEVGRKFILLIKINCSDFEYGGLDEEDFVEICEIIDQAGIDGIEVSGNFTSRPKIKPGINESYFKDYAEMLEGKVKCPIILVGGKQEHRKHE